MVPIWPPQPRRPLVAPGPRAWSAVAVTEAEDPPLRLEPRPRPAPLFELDQVEVRRGGRLVLGPVNLVIPTTGPVVVAGPSGSGKSSLLRLLNRLDVPSAGCVRFRGDDIADQGPTAHRRRVAMVFQRPVVLEGTIADNLAVADPALSPAAMAELLERVGLDPHLLDRPARDLSGGEAQRMGLARSLATRPDVVLFDEPTSSLDPASSARIEHLATALEADGIATIWVTHDLDQLRRIGAHVVFVIDGRVAQSGPIADVLAHPEPDVDAFLSGADE